METRRASQIGQLKGKRAPKSQIKTRPGAARARVLGFTSGRAVAVAVRRHTSLVYNTPRGGKPLGYYRARLISMRRRERASPLHRAGTGERVRGAGARLEKIPLIFSLFLLLVFLRILVICLLAIERRRLQKISTPNRF